MAAATDDTLVVPMKPRRIVALVVVVMVPALAGSMARSVDNRKRSCKSWSSGTSSLSSKCSTVVAGVALAVARPAAPVSQQL